MVLKGSATAVATLLVPPWGLEYDIEKDVPPGPPYPRVPPWGLVYDIKKDVFPPDPAYTLCCFGEERSVHLTQCVVNHRHV